MRRGDGGPVSNGLGGVFVGVLFVEDVVFSVYFCECFDVDW
jgi:hypothetical protein